MKKILMMFAVAALVFSCADEELQPIVTFDNIGKGAYVRLLSLDAPFLVDPSNIGGSQLAATVDFVDIDGGSTVAEYTISFSFDDNSPENGDNSKPAQQFRSFGPSDFTTSGRGNVGMSWSIPAQELLDAFGLTVDQLTAGDRFPMTSEVVTTSGSRHNAGNSSAAVNGDAFAGFFTQDANVTCPLPDNLFAGSYTLSYDGDAGGGFGVPFAEGEVTVSPVAGSLTQREFTVNWAPGIGGFDIGPLRFDIICDVSVWLFKDTGLACAGGSITLAAGDPSPIISLTDDSVIVLNIIEYQDDGGCGINPIPKTIILTKN